MHKWMFLALLPLLIWGCSLQKRPLITMEAYQETHVGMSEEALRQKFGAPLNTYVRDSGVVVYEYVERFPTIGGLNNNNYNNQMIESRRYYFYIKDGKVASKQVIIRNLPAYEPLNEV